MTDPKSCDHLHITFQQFFDCCVLWILCHCPPLCTPLNIPSSRIGSCPVEVQNPSIYQYDSNASKSFCLQPWKRPCSHLTLEILNVGLSPEIHVQENYFGRLLTEAVFPFLFSSEPFTKGNN